MAEKKSEESKPKAPMGIIIETIGKKPKPRKPAVKKSTIRKATASPNSSIQPTTQTPPRAPPVEPAPQSPSPQIVFSAPTPPAPSTPSPNSIEIIPVTMSQAVPETSQSSSTLAPTPSVQTIDKPSSPTASSTTEVPQSPLEVTASPIEAPKKATRKRSAPKKTGEANPTAVKRTRKTAEPANALGELPVKRTRTPRISTEAKASGVLGEIPARPRKPSARKVKTIESPSESPSKEVTPAKNESAAEVKKTTEEIIDRIPSFPGYLLNRMSKEAQRAIRIGVLEINRMKPDELEKWVEHLTPVRMFFDPSYENEKEILDFIQQKIAYMNKLLESSHERVGDSKFNEFIVQPLEKGKFDKFIQRWGSDYSVDDCALQIIQSLWGFQLKKIPLSEFALRKKLVQVLQQKFPNKEKKS